MSDFFDRVERSLVEALARENAQQSTPAPAATVPAPRRRAVWAASVLAVGAALAAVPVLVPFGSNGSGGLLSPERAAAAAAESLDGDGVLVWKARSFSEEPGDPPDVLETIVDLDSGASRRSRIASGRKDGERFTETSITWSSRSGTWMQVPLRQADGRITVRHQAADPLAPAGPATPVDELREALDNGAVSDEAPLNGVPVVRVTQNIAGRATQLWVTRERSPRLLRSIITSWSCDAGEKCMTPSNDATTSSIFTDEWTINKPTNELLSNLQPPAFPPDEYFVEQVG